MTSMCFADRLEPVCRILDFSDKDEVVWACSPMYGPDGMVHVFFTLVPPPQKNWFNLFRTHGRVMHAAAEQAEGPYTVIGEVIKGTEGSSWRGHGIVNPRIYTVNGIYALFYTAYEVPLPREKCREHIGLLLSDDLQTWEDGNNGNPVFSPAPNGWDSSIVNNTAFIQDTPVGPYCIYYRGTSEPDAPWHIGLAVADNPEGPYERVDRNPVINTAVLMQETGTSFRGFEDPCVWKANGSLNMLVKDMGYFEDPGACHMTSQDGITWSRPERGYYSSDHYWGEHGPLDSPQLLKKNGIPEYLFTNRFTSDKGTGFIFRIKNHD